MCTVKISKGVYLAHNVFYEVTNKACTIVVEVKVQSVSWGGQISEVLGSAAAAVDTVTVFSRANEAAGTRGLPSSSRVIP